MQEGEVLQWAGRQIRYIRLTQNELAGKLIAEVELEVTDHRGRAAILRPARHLHLLQDQWTTEVAIDSTWTADFYTVLHAGLGDGKVVLTLVVNPMIRWLWVGGILSAGSALVAIWPTTKRQSVSESGVEVWPSDETTLAQQAFRRNTHTKKAA
jgi:cytochrome c-type biogenesis protein CcmF